MRKEILLAIAAGGILGLVIAFGIWRANRLLSPKENQPSPQASSSPIVSGITIAKPENEEVITEATYEVSGVTTPNTWVVISGEEEDYVVQADTGGAFAEDVDLVAGINEIIVTSLAADKSSEAKVLVVYSTEFETNPDTLAQESTEEGNSVREKVLQKVEEARKVPRAYIGSVTDIVEKTIQIKSAAGEIKQAVTSDETTFVKAGTTTKEVKFTDLAIGDFVIAMGYKNGNGVLSTTRVLITNPKEPVSRKAIRAIVTSFEKSKITVSTKTGELEIEPAKVIRVTKLLDSKTSNIKFADIEEGEEIIIVGVSGENTIEARRIHIISSPTPSPSPSPKSPS